MNSLPIHLKPTASRASLSHINAVIEAEAADHSPDFILKWRYHYKFFTNWIVDELEGEPVIENRNLTAEEIQQLLAAGVIEVMPEGSRHGGGVKLFCVPEIQKARKRLIRWTRKLNELHKIDPALTVTFPAMEHIISAARTATYASAIDVSGMFDALSIDDDVRNAHVFSHQGTLYRLATVPTGQRQSAGIAHLISTWLAMPAGDLADVWIDNIRIKATPATLSAHAQIVAEIYQRAERIGLTFNERLEEAVIPQRHYDFLGITFDHTQQQVTVAGKTAAKLREARATFAQDFKQLHYGDALQTFGLLLHCERVLHVTKDRAKNYYIMKNLRRLARLDTNLDEKGGIWKSTKPLWTRWIDDIINAPPRIVVAPPQSMDMTIIVDASLAGWGAWIFADREMPTVLAAAWPNWLTALDPNIAELEIYAIATALATLDRGTDAHPINVHVISDNTTALHGCRKGNLRGFFQNAALLTLQKECKRINVTIAKSSYIKSENNPADFFSRLATQLKR